MIDVGYGAAVDAGNSLLPWHSRILAWVPAYAGMTVEGEGRWRVRDAGVDEGEVGEEWSASLATTVLSLLR